MARETAPKKIKIPKNLAQCADRLYNVRIERLTQSRKLDAVLEPLKLEETALRTHLIDTLPKSEAAGITGKVCNATITSKDVPQVKDWDAFYAFIKKENAFHLLGRAINAEAVEEMQEHKGKKWKMPGMGTFKVINVSLKKV